MDNLPYDVCYMLMRCLVYDVGIRKSLKYRLVCSRFSIVIEDIIYALPTFGKEDDQSPPHLTRDSRMPKVMIARLIQRKTRTHNGRYGSICSSIRRAADLLASFSIYEEQIALDECQRVLATTAANTLYISDIIKHLEATDEPDSYKETNHLENSLIAATYMQRVPAIKKLIGMGANVTTRTRFFGDAMTAAARSGSKDILIFFLDRSSSVMPSPMELLSHTAALEGASAVGHEHTVSVLLRRAALLRPHVLFDIAIQSAIRGKHELVALMLLHHRQPHIKEKEHMFWVNLLRTASETACDTVVDFVLKSSPTSFSEQHIALSIEDASQLGHVSTVRLLFSRPPSRTKLTGAAFLAAFHGRKEIVDLFIDELSESEECLIADTLAGAILNGRIDLVSHVLQRATGNMESELPQFGNSRFEIYVNAIHYWLDSRQGRPGYKSSPSSAVPSDQVLWTTCEEGKIGKARKLLSAFGSRENLKILCSAAASKSHPGLLLYLCQFVPPYLLPRIALESRSRAIFQVFLALGWNVNEPLDIVSPSMLGHVLDDEFLVRWLLDHGADPNARCDWDCTPMSRAVSRAPLPIIRLLFERGGSVRFGQLLHFAVERKEPDVIGVIDLLLDLGASLHEIQYHDPIVSWAENKWLGMGTPLHGAIQLKRKELVFYLLKRGADPMIKDPLGKTAIALAETGGCEEIIQSLRDSLAEKPCRKLD